MANTSDPHLDAIVHFLKTKQKCHTALLYGSRGRGLPGPVSDYDVVGIRKAGKKARIAKKQNGAYWDLSIYPEKDLAKLTDQHLSWREAKVLFEKNGYGRRLIERIKKLAHRPFKPTSKDEIEVILAWAEKQLDRIAVGDVQGLFRRAEMQNAAIEHYFQIRRVRYWGPKAGLEWLEQNDQKTFKLFAEVYRSPDDTGALKKLAERVYTR